MRNPFYLLLVLCIPINACTAQQYFVTKKAPSSVDSTTAPNSNVFAKEVLSEVNQLRNSGCKCGGKQMPATHPLSWNDQLTNAAQRHALDIAARQQLDHTGQDGSSVSSRVTDTGYSWGAVAENIAVGYWDIKGVIRGWVESPGHCRNMMNPDYKEVSVYRKDSYWVMVLATKM